MSSNDLLLGFDAREMWLGPKEDRPENRSCFFLRQDVIKQLSVDTTTWASIFEGDEAFPRPQWIGPIQRLWEDLQALETHLHMVSSGAKPYWVIAVTLCSDLCESAELEEWKTYRGAERIRPSVRDESWELLGYDVADQWLLSGLTNCGFDKKTEVEPIRKKYNPALNAYHLFDSIEPATEFQLLSDERVSGHAPFFVFGIWLIKKEEGRDHPERV